jgi:DNA polymerase III epsilon subunit-like protein
MKILIVDIETAPNLAYVWRFFQENVGAKQVKEHCSILSVSAKWLEKKKIFYYDTEHGSEKTLLKNLNKLLDEADVVVGHNSIKFDSPKIRGRSLVHGLPLPSPYKEIDTCRIARKEFGFESNSLEYLATVMGLTPKQSHKKFPGFELWAECLKGNPEAWKEMKKYNIQDIGTTEEMYLLLRPYATRHPNMTVLMDEDGSEIRCPKCTSTNNQRRGFYYTNVGKYQRYQCKDCGGWHRSRFTVLDKEVGKNLTINAI